MFYFLNENEGVDPYKNHAFPGSVAGDRGDLSAN